MSTNRDTFLLAFSARLIELLRRHGAISSRSNIGIKFNELAKIAECSQQMARRYVIGEALPDYPIIVKIATWLNVSPGWLLFGDSLTVPEGMNGIGLINIDYQMMEYILSKILPRFVEQEVSDKLTKFILDIIHDISHIKATRETIIKIIDMAASSLQFLTNNEIPSLKQERLKIEN